MFDEIKVYKSVLLVIVEVCIKLKLIKHENLEDILLHSKKYDNPKMRNFVAKTPLIYNLLRKTLFIEYNWYQTICINFEDLCLKLMNSDNPDVGFFKHVTNALSNFITKNSKLNSNKSLTSSFQ